MPDHRTVAAVYEYRDLTGQVRYRKTRFDPKDFVLERWTGQGWEYGLNGSGKLLYRLPELIAADPKAPVFLVEGEKDVEALRELGYTATTPGGSSDWRPEMASHLVKRHVVIIPDQDSPGQKAAETWQSALEPVTASLRVLPLPAPDFSDWMRAGGSKEALDALLAAPEGMGPFGLVSEVEAAPIHWLWRGYIPSGKLTIVEGDPGCGKSTFLLDLAARLSTGRCMPMSDEPVATGGVVVISGEDSAADTIRPRLEAAGADLSVIAHLPLGHPFTIPKDIGMLRRVVKHVKAKLVILDPLGCFLPDGIDENHNQSVRRALGPVAALADEMGAAVIALRHLTKVTGGPAKYRGLGSIGIGGAARAVLAVNPDLNYEDCYVISRVKGNLGAPVDPLKYRLLERGGAVAVEWLGDSATTWLRMFLKGRTLLGREIRDAGKHHGSEVLVQVRERGLKEGWLVQHGTGVKGDPAFYSLRGDEEDETI